MQCGRVFPEEKKKLNNTNTFNDGVSGFRIEIMSTIYLGFNIENVTFKISQKKLEQGNVTFNINTTSSFPRECPVCLHDVGASVCVTQIPGAFTDANDV